MRFGARSLAMTSRSFLTFRNGPFSGYLLQRHSKISKSSGRDGARRVNLWPSFNSLLFLGKLPHVAVQAVSVLLTGPSPFFDESLALCECHRRGGARAHYSPPLCFHLHRNNTSRRRYYYSDSKNEKFKRKGGSHWHFCVHPPIPSSHIPSDSNRCSCRVGLCHSQRYTRSWCSDNAIAKRQDVLFMWRLI